MPRLFKSPWLSWLKRFKIKQAAVCLFVCLKVSRKIKFVFNNFRSPEFWSIHKYNFFSGLNWSVGISLCCWYNCINGAIKGYSWNFISCFVCWNISKFSFTIFLDMKNVLYLMFMCVHANILGWMAGKLVYYSIM